MEIILSAAIGAPELASIIKSETLNYRMTQQTRKYGYGPEARDHLRGEDRLFLRPDQARTHTCELPHGDGCVAASDSCVLWLEALGVVGLKYHII